MNFSELSEKLKKYNNTVTLHPKWLFRGQADYSWSLTPSFTRLANSKNLDRNQTLQLERESVNKFSISASQLLPIENTVALTLSRLKSPGGKGLDFLGWFVLMQHYSAPTRKLDWSISSWVALYFSCCEEKNSDGAIWIANFEKITNYGNRRLKGRDFANLLTDKDSEEILVFSMAFNTNERIEAQQGRFSVCTNPLSNHETLMNECKGIEKVTIPKELKPEILCELHKMNISAKTLFPGIDGLGKSICEYCELWDENSVIE